MPLAAKPRRTSHFRRRGPHVMFLHNLPQSLACSVFTACSRRRNALRLNRAVSASAKLETNPVIGIREHNGRGAMLLLTQSLVQPFQKCFHSPLISPSL